MAGLALAAAGCLGLWQFERLPGGLAWGLVLLAVGTLVATVLPHAGLVGPVLALPGAWVVAVHAGVAPVGWIRVLVVVAIVVGGAAAADFDERWGRKGWGQILLAVSSFGIYVTVPDTEHALVLLWAAAAVALSGWPFPLTAVGRAGSFTAVGIVVWVAAVDGIGRHSSIVAGVACLGVLVIEPIVRALRGGRSPLELVDRLRFVPLRAVAVATAHLGLVLVAARVAGLRSSLCTAVLIVAVETALAVLAGLAIVRWTAARLNGTGT